MADTSRRDVPPDSQVASLRSGAQIQELLDNGTSFDAGLFRLMNKADNSNWKKLAKAFPHQAMEYTNWLRNRG